MITLSYLTVKQRIIVRNNFKEITMHIRIDTHEDNVVMQNLLKKLGFKFCGIIHLKNGDKRLAYEKIKSK